MANAKEIQDRMKSINDTLKITNAMYMISSSKLKKSKKMLTDTEPYFFTLQSEMSRILRHLPDLDSIYFRSTDEIPEEDVYCDNVWEIYIDELTVNCEGTGGMVNRGSFTVEGTLYKIEYLCGEENTGLTEEEFTNLVRGLLGRENVILLVSDKKIELPGDLKGVVYEGDGINVNIAKELKSMGLDIDLNKVVI